jgi:hypothetical protein
MKTGYMWVFWSALALMVITAVTILTVITEITLFRATPLIYTTILVITAIGLGLIMQNRYYLPILRNMRFQGKLLLSPLTLLVLSVPAALIYIYYDLNGKETLSLLSALFTSLAAVFFLTFMFIVTLPSMATVRHLYKEGCVVPEKSCSLPARITGAILALTLILLFVRFLTGFNASGLVLLLPLYALLLIILGIVLSVDFRTGLFEKIASVPRVVSYSDMPADSKDPVRGFRSVLLVADHYLDLISGRLDYLANHADGSYASEVVTTAAKTFDPALLPALKLIASSNSFGEQVNREAAGIIAGIEKYYTDPVRNSELLRHSGVSDKTAAARSIMLNRREPQVQEIVKLMADTNIEIRRTGIIAAGRYGTTDLREEVLQAVTYPETAREAFYVLRHFGPGQFGDMIGTSLRSTTSEKENLMIMNLLGMMPLSAALPYLNRFIDGGHISVRRKAATHLCRQGFVPQGKQRQRIELVLNETLHTIARLIALHLEAKRNKSFMLAAALAYEREVNSGFMFSLLTLLTGRPAAEVISSCSGDDTACGSAIASETIDTVTSGTISRPLKALMGNHDDIDRLAELSLCYPLRELKGRSVASFILSSELTITGTWTKACALQRVAADGRGLDREMAVSYLFSNSQLLQEESARAIRTMNPEWYGEAEARLPETARHRIATVVSGNMPDAALLFEKTRFLSLCFRGVPEEKMILLASSLRYSESYDAGSIPGIISWIVPSHNGKSGLYSLRVSDIATFVFYYSEYTDIFVNYMDNQGGISVR